MLDAAYRTAIRVGERADAVEILLWMGFSRAKSRDAHACDYIEEAGRICETIRDPKLREREQASVRLLRALSGTGNGSLSDIDTAISFSRASASRMWLPELRLARGRILRSSAKPVEAEREFIEAIRGIREQQESGDFSTRDVVNRECLSNLIEEAEITA